MIIYSSWETFARYSITISFFRCDGLYGDRSGCGVWRDSGRGGGGRGGPIPQPRPQWHWRAAPSLSIRPGLQWGLPRTYGWPRVRPYVFSLAEDHICKLGNTATEYSDDREGKCGIPSSFQWPTALFPRQKYHSVGYTLIYFWALGFEL